MTVRTRFAPSPTGFLHIGGARTAIFNWLFAKHHNGQFLLRIEDTDRARSSQEAIDAILHEMAWLGLTTDEAIVFQSQNATRHIDVAKTLHEKGHAYYCTCAPEEIEAMREKARKEGRVPKYDGTCRHAGHTQGALRIALPTSGELTFTDAVQGTVTLKNEQLDDYVILRADGTPTYMLSVVVDDHDMEISHVIRGDDHLTNTFKQIHLYNALAWALPTFAHVPLIHGPDGAKFSKRHGAPGVGDYAAQGFLKDAIFNYLLRLGWSHGDDEIISRDQAIEWFTFKGLGKSAARFDIKKLTHLNAHYLRATANVDLCKALTPFFEKDLARTLSPTEEARITKGMDGIKQRANTLLELAENARIYTDNLPSITEKAQKFCTPAIQKLLEAAYTALENVTRWDHDTLQETMRAFAAAQEMGLGKIAQPLRVALCHSTISPSVFEVMEVLEKEISLERLRVFMAADFN